MNIINLEENACFEPGNFYADIAADEGPSALIKKINADGTDDTIADYDLIWASVKITEANNGRDASSEEEYNAFIKWLEGYKDMIETIYVTYELLSFFHFPFEDEVYIDPVDGFAKFPDSEE